MAAGTADSTRALNRKGRAFCVRTVDPNRVEALPREQVPEVLGQLERLRVLLRALLSTPPAPAPLPTGATGPDRLLNADEAATMLGVSRRWALTEERAEMCERLQQAPLGFPSVHLVVGLDHHGERSDATPTV
jgi:hypothetical protein